MMQNARPYVNAAFSMEVNSSNKFSVLGTPILVIGGGSTRPVSYSAEMNYSETCTLATTTCEPGASGSGPFLERSKKCCWYRAEWP